MIRIYFNPVCSKARIARDVCIGAGIEFESVEYLVTPPTAEQLKDIMSRLKDSKVTELVRQDIRFNNLGLQESDVQTEDQIIEVLTQYPELLQRPLIDDGNSVIIARDPQILEEWIKKNSH